MAYNSKENKRENTLRINKLIEQLKQNKEEELRPIIDGLEAAKSRGLSKIRPVSFYIDVVDAIRQNTDMPSHYDNHVKSAEELYDRLFPFAENTPDFDKTAEIFMTLIGGTGLAAQGYFDLLLFSSFEDKYNYLTMVEAIAGIKNGNKMFGKLRKYAMEVREFFVDDVSFVAHILKVAGRLSPLGPNGYDAILDSELISIRRSNGIYDIDPVRLAQVEQNVSEAALILKGSKSVLETLDHKRQNMERFSDEIDKKAKDIARTTEVYLESKAENAKTFLDETLAEYEANQKKAIFMEKDILVKQVFADAENELGKYKAMAKSIVSSAATDVENLRREADDVIARLKRAESSNEKIREFTDRSHGDEELLEKIAKLTMLNDAMMERFQAEPAAPSREKKGAAASDEQAYEGGQAEAADGAASKEGQAGEELAVASSHPRNKDLPIPKTNPLLDRSIPFKERFALVQKEKERRIAQGEIFHEMFDDVITAVMEDVNPYLIGPSGCGKTYMVSQIGSILNLDCTDIGYINEEYDILGYVTAMGEYSESNFYRLYKYGGIAFCDELDNGNSKATVKLNSFLSNQEYSCYYFPGGERVDKHANFRVIAAGNTDGSGADINYSTREKIEESVQQRMIPIYVDYDNRVEKAILKDYPTWFEFACAFREATDEWSDVCGIPAQGIFTTRDAYRIKRYLDNGSFTEEKVINYEFVQTKEPEYLGFLKEKMAEKLKNNKETWRLYQMFAAETERVRKRGKRV